MQPTYTAIVKKRVTEFLPIVDSAGRPVFLDDQGKSIPRDQAGALSVPSTNRKVETISTDLTVNPLTDDAGNPIEAGTPEALLRRVREHFDGDKSVAILQVLVQEIRIVREVGPEELAAVK